MYADLQSLVIDPSVCPRVSFFFLGTMSLPMPLHSLQFALSNVCSPPRSKNIPTLVWNQNDSWPCHSCRLTWQSTYTVKYITFGHWMCVFVYVCVHPCMWVCVCVHGCVCACVCVCVSVCLGGWAQHSY